MQHAVSRLVSMGAPAEFPLTLDRINLPVLMQRACEYYRKRAASDNIHILCSPAAEMALAWGDRVAVAVIADNLLSNAVRVSRPNGTIHVQVMTEPGYVVCRITDAGSGLTPEQRAGQFRAPLSSPPHGGTEVSADVGLTIAHEFVRRLDGDLWCESQPGQGACFSFRLPAVE
jgi:signal transduction histidine kinase